ncbi:MAG: MotA/TolQ/ExbB proton channel family protein [Flavobacteriaceae bacterium]
MNQIQSNSLSVIDMIVNGGAGSIIIILILFALLMLAVYIYAERTLTFNGLLKLDSGFVDDLNKELRRNSMNVQKAITICKKSDHPSARIIRRGLERFKDKNELGPTKTAIENEAQFVVYGLERNINILATISGAAPMIGFLGTVIGMIIAFHQMANSGGQAEMAELASGIYTAMTTTVGGLIVGILSYIGYNHLVTRTQLIVHDLEKKASEFLEELDK